MAIDSNVRSYLTIAPKEKSSVQQEKFIVQQRLETFSGKNVI